MAQVQHSACKCSLESIDINVSMQLRQLHAQNNQRNARPQAAILRGKMVCSAPNCDHQCHNPWLLLSAQRTFDTPREQLLE